MISDIRPVNELSHAPQAANERERSERQPNTKEEKVFFSDKLSNNEIEELIGELNDAMKIMSTKLAFSVDNATNRPIIQVMERDSGEIIRQIPPEELLRVSQRIHEVLGVLFDERG